MAVVHHKTDYTSVCPAVLEIPAIAHPITEDR